MDTKLKVILVIFGIIMILYFINFAITMTNKVKEKFVDMRIENFTNNTAQESNYKPSSKSSPVAQEVPISSAYDIRLMILNAVENNSIQDKEARLTITTTMFQNVGQYKGMSQDQLDEVVKSLMKKEGLVPEAESSLKVESFRPSGNQMPGVDMTVLQEDIDVVQQELNITQKKISDMQKYVKSPLRSTTSAEQKKENFEESLIDNSYNAVTNFVTNMISPKNQVSSKEPFVQDISGIENVRNFAMYME